MLTVIKLQCADKKERFMSIGTEAPAQKGMSI